MRWRDGFFRCLLPWLLLLGFRVEIAAQEALYPDFSQVQGEFWVERSRLSSYDAPFIEQIPDEMTTEESVLILLELSRRMFSGMIYGFNFYYQPSDNLRQVEEIFSLEPIHQIPWGDSGLKYIGHIENDGRIEMSFRYLTKDYEIARLKGWRSTRFPNSSGGAASPDRANLRSRLESLEMAVKEALRSHFRAIILNKPRSIRGRLALLSMPRSYPESGLIYTTVNIVIDTDVVTPYRLF